LKVSPFFHTYLSLLSINDYQSSMKYFTEDGHFHLNIASEAFTPEERPTFSSNMTQSG